jgi:hypothetical protein
MMPFGAGLARPRPGSHIWSGPDLANEPPTDDQEGLTAFWRSGL